MIDADPQGSLSISLGVQEPDKLSYSLATVMMNIINDEEVNHDMPQLAMRQKSM